MDSQAVVGAQRCGRWTDRLWLVGSQAVAGGLRGCGLTVAVAVLVIDVVAAAVAVAAAPFSKAPHRTTSVAVSAPDSQCAIAIKTHGSKDSRQAEISLAEEAPAIEAMVQYT